MNGYSVKLPLKYDLGDGPYSMNKNLKEVTAQNFKMLLLTNKGERIMDTNYGIGLRSLLFHNRTNNVSEINIEDVIRSQVSIYMPFINIEKVTLNDNLESEVNSLFISIDYSIPSIEQVDNISLILNQN